LGLSTWSFLRERAARTQLEQARAGETAALDQARQNAEAEALQRARAQATVTRLEIDRAETLFKDGQSAEALAYLARVVRREPTNRVAGERIISALALRNFCVPLFRLEHKADVTSAEFSPDGQRVLTVSKEGGAQTWDGRTGQPLLGPFQHAGEVTAAHFNHDGSRVITVSSDKTARIWDAQTGRSVTELLRLEGVVCADFSPDGQRVVTGSAEGSMRQWDASTGMSVGATGMFNAAITFVKFSPDGKWIVLGSRSDVGRVLNAADGEVHAGYEPCSVAAYPSFSRDGTRMMIVPSGGKLSIMGTGLGSKERVTREIDANGVKCALFSPDGQTVATSSFDGFATIWEAETLQPVVEKKMHHGHWVEAIAFSPDGEQVVTGSKDHTVRIWDARTGQPLSEPLHHDANVVSVQFSADGQRVLSVCEGPGAWVWEVRGGQPLTATLQHPNSVRKAVFSPDGGSAATSTMGPNPDDTLVRLWDTQRAIPLLPPLEYGSYEVQFSPDGRLLLGVDGWGTNTVWDTSNGQVIGRPFCNTNGSSARFSPDGQLVISGGGYGGGVGRRYGSEIQVFRVATGSPVARFSHPTNAGFAQFSPDGRWVITTSQDRTARLWDWRTGRPLMEPLHHDGDVVWADVSADSQRIVTLSRDQWARIWEASSGRLLHKLPHAEEPYDYNSVQFSPDGRLVVVASGNTAQIWDSATGQSVTAPLKHDGRVNSVRFSPDGMRLVTACADHTARIWDTATGHSVSELLRHGAQVIYAEFSPNGRWVITASDDATAKIWEVPMLTPALPSWLADWAEAVAGQRIDERNAKQPVLFDAANRLRQNLTQAPGGDEATRWAKWFLAEKMTRAISPSSAMTVAQFVAQRIEQSTMDSLQQAARLSPTNGLAQARLAYISLTNEAAPNPRLVASADRRSRRGLELSPHEPEAWWARAQFCEHLGRSTEALHAMDQATNLDPTITNANFWYGKGLLLEKTNRLEEALQAYTKAIELSGPWKDSQTLPALGYANRSKLNRQLNRLFEAAADQLNVLNLNLRQRDPGTPDALLDLSLFYNHGLDIVISTGGGVHNFTKLPHGRQTLIGGTEFDIRGVVSLRISEQVLGIPVAQRCRRLHFLHVGTGQMKTDGVEVGIYQVHYADGQQKRIPIIYGEHLRDHTLEWDPKEALARNTKVAWVGDTPDKLRIRVFETTWENERPDVAIESLDLISGKDRTTPILFAITVEP
jgi:WD40 repeat protein